VGRSDLPATDERSRTSGRVGSRVDADTVPPMIREMTAADLARVLAINEGNVPEVGSIDMAQLEFLVEEAELALVVQPDEQEIAGFCLVLGQHSTYQSVNYRWFMDRYDDAWYLDRVAFDTEYRGRGLGTMLYDHVHEQVSAAPGIARWTLEVNVDPPNEPSLGFHAARGFVEVGRQHTPYGITVSLMSRPTTPPPHSSTVNA
jgi:predicted GNAT superfamily acetyltransferase